jgi:DNA-binding SARP family transcriptional activator/tetratricopeptide (TPR) repeat protein
MPRHRPEGQVVELRVLGLVELLVGGQPLNLGKRQHRLILGILSIEASRPVHRDRLIELLWSDRPPRDPRAVLQTRISELRAALDAARRNEDNERLLTHGSSYELRIAPEQVDLHRFRRLVADSRGAGSDAEIRARLRAALDLWRGPVLGGWLPPTSHDALCRGLEAARLTAAEDLFEVELRLGHHQSIVDELLDMSTAHPGRDRLTAALLLALHRSGRTAEATAAYDRHRRWLAAEFGVEPGQDLERLYVAILRGAPELGAGSQRAQIGAVPRQLPTSVRHFVGRAAELRALTELVDQHRANRGAVVISSINGAAGIGKTALAVCWAHLVADRFADGQLYINLRGFDPTGTPTTPPDAVRELLDALQVPPDRIPASLDAQVGLYRSVLSDKRVLIVLDNARDAEQVRPLLPGTPTCLVLVTSRNQLSSLVAVEGAQQLTLDVLAADDARLLLTRRLGADRVAAEPRAVDRIVARCAGLPLAIAIVAARAAAHPTFALATLAEQLSEARGRLDALALGDPASDLRAVFSWSYQALGDAAARLYRLLGLHPGPDVSVSAVVSLAGLDLLAVRVLLAELTSANLLVEHEPGRYTFHDLLRAYATEQVHVHETAEQRAAASRRMLDHYLHTANAATLMLKRYAQQVALSQPLPGVVPEHIADRQQAIAWYTAEHSVLVAAIHHAAASGVDTHAWQLAYTISTFFERRGHWHDQVITQRAALVAADRLGDTSAQAGVHYKLGRASTLLGHLDDAETHLRCALDLYCRSGDQEGQATTQDALAEVWSRRGDHVNALRHATVALHLSRTTGHVIGQARALNTVGWLNGQLGNHRTALAACGRALTLFQQLDDRTGQADTWDSLGYAHHHLGNHAKAIACYQHAIELYRDLGHRRGEFGALTCLGDTYQSADDPAAARTAWQEALAILVDLAHPDADKVRSKLADGSGRIEGDRDGDRVRS